MTGPIIYDRHGIAMAFWSHGVLYDYVGTPRAFLDGEDILSYSGKHLGWFAEGYIRDHDGNAVGFAEGAQGGPLLPIRGLPPVAPIRGIEPIRPIRPIPPIKPIFTFQWGMETVEGSLQGL